MAEPIAAALRILGHFWLEELKPTDKELLETIPELAETLSASKAGAPDNLAVEYQRLFGFNLPPYESVFIDPSVMLMSPATARVQRLYQQSGWQPPVDIRTGAPDHIGLEMMALADLLGRQNLPAANQLHTNHLALWVPAFILTLKRLRPDVFYHTLADLTLDLILSTLPEDGLPDNKDPFPKLPPPPVYRASGPDESAGNAPSAVHRKTERLIPLPASPEDEQTNQEATRLRDVVKMLLPPRETGIFLTREDIARTAQALALPVAAMGDRARMLETLFRQAGEYNLVPALFGQLQQLADQTATAYQTLAREYPYWRIYATAWQTRLANTQEILAELTTIATETDINQS
jgi:TorA maturation chaperone TorD